jgi:hypothetical protein
MPTLIEEIQRDCIDSTASVSFLLGKAKLAASKLAVAKVEEWVDHDLKGYTDTVPDYRMVRGTPMAWSPYRGSEPILGSGVEELSFGAVGESIASLEECLSSGRDLSINYPASITKILDEQNGVHGHYYLPISRSQIKRIIDRVRTLVLDWAIQLEKAGIVGSGISFTDGDRQKAQATATMLITIGSVHTFTGNLGHGNVSGAISSGIDVAAARSLLEDLRLHEKDLVREGVDAALNARVAALEAELKKSSPDQSKLSMLLNDVRNAVSGAAGNIIASGILFKINTLFGG